MLARIYNISIQFTVCVTTVVFREEKKGKKSLTLLNNGYVCECLKNWSTRWKRFISQKVPGTLSITAHTILCPGKTHMLPKCTKTNKVFSNKTFRRYTAIQKGYSIGEEAQCRQKGAQHQLIQVSVKKKYIQWCSHQWKYIIAQSPAVSFLDTPSKLNILQSKVDGQLNCYVFVFESVCVGVKCVVVKHKQTTGQPLSCQPLHTGKYTGN